MGWHPPTPRLRASLPQRAALLQETSHSIFFFLKTFSCFLLRLGNCTWACKNIVFDLRLIESADVNLMDTKGTLYSLKKNLCISATGRFKLVLFEGQLDLIMTINNYITALHSYYITHFIGILCCILSHVGKWWLRLYSQGPLIFRHLR